jgi:hypothetical protein
MGYSSLPDTFRHYIGLDTAAEAELIRMNDDYNANFNTIADYIEENL